MKKTLLYSSLVIPIIFYFFHVSNSGNSICTWEQKTINKTLSGNNDSITFKTFYLDSGWGYDIYLNEQLYIHQPIIPAIIGNKGFSEEKYAEETAKRVIEKIRKHILPPDVTPAELDSMNVLKER
jgi:hypothetical protein